MDPVARELEWLRQDISVLNVHVDRRHAFLTTVRNRARAHADLCEQVERRAARMRVDLQEHRVREQQAHRSLIDEERVHASRQQSTGDRRAGVAAQLLSNNDTAVNGDWGGLQGAEGGMWALLMRTRRESFRAQTINLEPFPLATFESRAFILEADVADDEVKRGQHFYNVCMR